MNTRNKTELIEYITTPHNTYGIFDTEVTPLYMIIIYSFMGVFGIMGNIVTCFVIVSNKSMRTATNCYLFNLAVSDLMMLIWAYPPLNGYLKYNTVSMCVIRALLAESAVYVSILTISVFSVERYIAICHPFFAQTLSKWSRAVITIPIVWLIAFLAALPITMQLGLVHHLEDVEISLCTITTIIVPHSFEISSLIFFIIPIFLISIMYALIVLRLRKSKRLKRDLPRSAGNKSKDAKADRVPWMLVAVGVSFFVCWAPFHMQRMMSVYLADILSDKIDDVFYIFTPISSVLYYSSAMINPILYNIMSKKFRSAFRDTFLKSSKILKLNSLKLPKINYRRGSEKSSKSTNDTIEL